MKYLIQFDDHRALDPGIVGAKFAALARAARMGFDVPPAAAVATAAHRFFLSHRRWPDGLAEEVAALGTILGLSRGLSIRSSAVREDLEKQSFAGQYRSFLRVESADDLQRKIEMCWLSAERDTVRSYLQAGTHGEPAADIPLMGVALQRMVEAAAAGVAFGRNPLHPARDEVVIEAIGGSGERLVSGHVSPYRGFVGKGAELRVMRPRDRVYRAPFDGDGCPLHDDDWRRIAALLRRLETVTEQTPLDIEWAIDTARDLWLLQVRRITTIDAAARDAPPGIWTRRIADDLWADRLTPFMAHVMLSNAPRYNLSRISKIVGIPTVDPSLAVINGYLYVNCDGIREAVARIPVCLRPQDLRSFFPDAQMYEEIPPPGTAALLVHGLRGLLLLLLEPEVNPLVCRWRTRRHRERIEKRFERFEKLPCGDAGHALKRLLFALETMALIQVHNQWPYFHATFFTWLLRWLVVDRGKASHGQFLALLGQGSDNVTLTIEHWFRQMARRVLANREVRDLFDRHTAEEVLRSLPADTQRDLNRFLKKYGCRSRHRSLTVPRWAEAPQEAIGILQSLVRGQPDTETPGAQMPGIPGAAASTAAPAPFTGGVWLHDWSLAIILRLTRRFLDLREELRFLLDRALYDIRRALLVLGERTGLGESVLFLDVARLEQLVGGGLSRGEAKAVAAEGHRRFLEPVTVSTFVMDGRPVESFPLTAEVFEGIGTSAGRATGRARIITDPSRAKIRKGDILVAENTDPGWTPILSLAGGMVMEEGGLLNHCSIVARELRVPAVVGVRQATRRIREGAVITIDGGLGLIRVEEDEAGAVGSPSPGDRLRRRED